MNKIIEGLRGDVVFTAREVGVNHLLSKTGVQELLEAVRGHAFAEARTEAEVLYRAGCSSKGIMARQTGEAINNYVLRRRWWDRVTMLGPTIKSTSKKRGVLMLEAADLLNEEKQSITDKAKELGFEIVAMVLQEQNTTESLDKEEALQDEFVRGAEREEQPVCAEKEDGVLPASKK